MLYQPHDEALACASPTNQWRNKRRTVIARLAEHAAGPVCCNPAMQCGPSRVQNPECYNVHFGTRHANRWLSLRSDWVCLLHGRGNL